MGYRYALLAVALCVMAHGATSLNCRSGFVSVINGRPMNYWNESVSCAADSAQSCFIGEVTYPIKFFEEDIKVTYGSCISTAYESYLKCESLFGPSGMDLGVLAPVLKDQFDGFVMDLSQKVAEQINEQIENITSDPNKTVDFINNVLGQMNMTVPDHLVPLIKFMINFNASDPTNGVEQLIDALVPMIPAEHNNTIPLLESLPTLIMQLENGNDSYVSTWYINLLMTYGMTTPATEALSNSIYQLLMRFGVYDQLDAVVIAEIKYYPGHAYKRYPNKTMQIDDFYYNVSSALDKIEPGMFNSTDFNISMFLNETLNMLEMMNMTLSNKTMQAIEILPQLIEAIQMNATANASMLLDEIINLLVPPATNASDALSKALIYYVEQVTGMKPNGTLVVVLEVLPRMVYKHFPDNITLIDQIFMNITDGLMNYNYSATPEMPSFDNMFPGDFLANLTSMLSPEMVMFLNSTKDIAAAIFANNSMAINESIHEFAADYCYSNNVTDEYANAIYNAMKGYGVNMTEEYKTLYRCFPGALMAIFPNQTENITMLFHLLSLQYTNRTAYWEAILGEYNHTLTPEMVQLIQFMDQFQQVAMTGNWTEIAKFLYETANATTPTTELSKLIVTLLTVNGYNVTAANGLQIRMFANDMYQFVINDTKTMDMFFSALNSGIANGGELGPSIIIAAATSGIQLPSEALYVFENMQPVITAAKSGDMEAYRSALLALMMGFNNQFPNDQLQLQIYYLQLQIEAGKLNATTGITPEIFELVGKIFNQTLKTANVTYDQFMQMLDKRFPGLHTILEIMSQLDSTEIAGTATDLVMWLADPDRNVTTLASIVNSTIHLIIENADIDIRALLDGAFQPATCKYESCTTDLCNTAELIENATVVTPRPDQTNAAATSNAQTSTVNPRLTTAVTTTTSGGERVGGSTVSVFFLITSLFIAVKSVYAV